MIKFAGLSRLVGVTAWRPPDVHQVVPQLPLQPVKLCFINTITPWLCQQVRYTVMQLPALSYCVHGINSLKV
jgi:hypothetical protein